jgi:germacradienol/geosmin synthase
VPPEVYRTGPVRSLENAAMDYACLINDIVSYQKEIEYEGEIHNAILVVQNFFGCDLDRARTIVADLMVQRMRQFQHVVAHELPVLYEDFGLSDEARAVLDGYVTELEHWMSGILNWHLHCRRYTEPELARRRATPPRPSLPQMPMAPGTAQWLPAGWGYLPRPQGSGGGSAKIPSSIPVAWPTSIR